MMGQIFQLRKEKLQILPEHRSGHLPVGLATRAHLKNKSQYPVDHQCRQFVLYLFGVSRILDLGQPLEQHGQLGAKDPYFLGNHLIAGTALLFYVPIFTLVI